MIPRPAMSLSIRVHDCLLISNGSKWYCRRCLGNTGECRRRAWPSWFVRSESAAGCPGGARLDELGSLLSAWLLCGPWWPLLLWGNNYGGLDDQFVVARRLFLQVECLSDVCTADGLTTDPGLEEKPPKVSSQSTIKWPRQGLPGPRSWAVWRRFLRPYTRDSTNNRLRQTLGPWDTWNSTDLRMRMTPAYRTYISTQNNP
jgi:hypothetical protein